MSTTTTTTIEAPQAGAISAETILRLFPDIDTSSTSELDGHDEEQIRLMDEVCIVLDENDQAIGTASKKICALRRSFARGHIAKKSLARLKRHHIVWLTTGRRPSDDQH